MTTNRRSPALRGFTRPEVAILLALVGVVALFAATYVNAIDRHERLLRDVRGVQFLLMSARGEAMKRHQQVVVFFDLKGRRVAAWVDVMPNFVPDAGEPSLVDQPMAPNLFFRDAAAGEATNGPGAVRFDEYAGQPSLADRVVFRADGALVEPEQPDCRAPRSPRHLSVHVPGGSMDCNPSHRCRGIYLTDRMSASSGTLDLFRVGVDDPGQSGTVTVLKWLPPSRGANAGETDYVPPPWKWTN